MKIILIVPTYNERDNIQELVPALQEQFQLLPHDMHILVVDDNSPDGTAAVVQKLKRCHPNLHLSSGEKRGLGAAYVRGMRHAIENLHADAVFEMDADFSHKPEDVPRLIAELELGADFVIGSRYVEGGSLPSEWGLLRRMNSKFGNIVGRYLAGLYRVRDCTAGFRAIDANLLRRIDFEQITVQGYAFQISLLQRAMAEGAVIREVPVDFIDRTMGESKLSLSDVTEFILAAASIRLQSSRTFVKFAIAGATGILINLGAFQLLLDAGTNKYLASPVAIELSIIWNFLLNNYWTFRSRKTSDRTRVMGLKFNLVCFISLAVSYSTFSALSFANPAGLPILHQFLGIIPAVLVNYFMDSNWTFRRQSDGSPLDRDQNRLSPHR
jgi:dolichol-phosphate mannosyltransferase